MPKGPRGVEMLAILRAQTGSFMRYVLPLCMLVVVASSSVAFSQQVLDIAEAEGEPGIEPDGLLNDHGWKAISGVTDLGHDGHLRPQITADKLNNVTKSASGLRSAAGCTKPKLRSLESFRHSASPQPELENDQAQSDHRPQRHRDSHFRKCTDRALTRPRLRMPVESLRSARPRCPCFLALRRDWISRTIGPWHA